MAITLTEDAISAVKDVLEQQDVTGKAYLRISVKGGGCSGFSYSLDVVHKKHDNDSEWEYDGIKVVCDTKSLLYLDGTEIGFMNEVMGRGFTFNNPNTTNSCGCGSSFSV